MLIKIALFIANTYGEIATGLWLHIPNLASEVPTVSLQVSCETRLGWNCSLSSTSLWSL